MNTIASLDTPLTGVPPIECEPPSKGLVRDLFAVFAGSLLVFWAFYAFMDNTNINTTNGLWKSITMKPWVENDPKRHVLNANVLFFPVNGAIIRYMPESLGPIHRRMAILHGFYGALGVAAVFALLRGLGIGRVPALGGAIFQAGCAFYLISSIISEDIMPAVAFLMIACALVAWSWDRFSYLGLFLTAQAFSLAWLFEWRLLPPSLPAFLAAILLAPSTWGQRIKRCCAFLAAAMVMPIIVASVMKYHGDTRSLLTILDGFLFVDKGLGTGWAGWATKKIVLLYVGIQEYLFRGKNVGHPDSFYKSVPIVSQIAMWSVLLSLMVTGLWFARRNWQQIRWRSISVVLIGIFGCAEVFNLYSQPQDPQMQMNAMLWVAVAWGMLLYLGISRFQSRQTLASCIALSLSTCPLLINFCLLLPLRGKDTTQMRTVARLVEVAPPDRTVIAMMSNEGIVTWMASLQGVDYYTTPTLEITPEPRNTWKMLYMPIEGTQFPQHSGKESATIIQGRIESALDRGVQVVVNNRWDSPEDDYVGGWATYSNEDKPREIYRMLHSNYEAVMIMPKDPQIPISPLYELRRKPVNVAREQVPQTPERVARKQAE